MGANDRIINIYSQINERDKGIAPLSHALCLVLEAAHKAEAVT